MLLSLVSRWEREAVSSGKVTAGLQVEQATEHTDPKSIPTSGSSLMYVKFMFDSPQGFISHLSPLIIKISRFEVYLRVFLFLC